MRLGLMTQPGIKILAFGRAYDTARLRANGSAYSFLLRRRLAIVTFVWFK